MQQHGSRFKNGKNLGHNLTVTRLISLPKTRLRTTTGHYIESTHFEIVVGMFRGCRGRSSGGRRTSSKSSISCLLTAVRRFFGSSSNFVTVGRPIPRERERFLFDAVFFAIGGSWWFRGVFCACFVLFDCNYNYRSASIFRKQDTMELIGMVHYLQVMTIQWIFQLSHSPWMVVTCRSCHTQYAQLHPVMTMD